MRDFFRKLEIREDGANKQQFFGKDITTRFRGLNRSKRNEAKALLVAIVPALVLAPFVPKWSEAAQLQKFAMVVVGCWAAIIGGLWLKVVFCSAFRAMRAGK